MIESQLLTRSKLSTMSRVSESVLCIPLLLLVSTGFAQPPDFQLSSRSSYFADGPSGGYEGLQSLTDDDGPIHTSVSDQVGLFSARSTADFGRVEAAVLLDPSTASMGAQVFGIAHFGDRLTIAGDNTGDTATITISMHQTGILSAPMQVNDSHAFLEAYINWIAYGSDGRFVDDVYRVSSPILATVDSFDTVSTFTMTFIVGETIRLSADLHVEIFAGGWEIEPQLPDFLAQVQCTGTLLPFELNGIVNPTITSASGHRYAISGEVPEPAAGLLLVVAIATLAARRARTD